MTREPETPEQVRRRQALVLAEAARRIADSYRVDESWDYRLPEKYQWERDTYRKIR